MSKRLAFSNGDVDEARVCPDCDLVVALADNYCRHCGHAL